jgi:hypothetical protein
MALYGSTKADQLKSRKRNDSCNSILELAKPFTSPLVKTYVFPNIWVPGVSMSIQIYVALEISIYNKMHYLSQETYT